METLSQPVLDREHGLSCVDVGCPSGLLGVASAQSFREKNEGFPSLTSWLRRRLSGDTGSLRGHEAERRTNRACCIRLIAASIPMIPSQPHQLLSCSKNSKQTRQTEPFQVGTDTNRSTNMSVGIVLLSMASVRAITNRACE